MQTHMIGGTLVLVGAIAVIGGCGNPTVGCSDPEIQKLVLEIIQSNHDDGYGFEDNPKMRARVNELADKAYKISKIVTRRAPTSSAALAVCKAQLEYTSYHVVRDEHEPQKDFMTDPTSLIREGTRSTQLTSITYSAGRTDDGKAFVEVSFD